jgi:hypothetical protein
MLISSETLITLTQPLPVIVRLLVMLLKLCVGVKFLKALDASCRSWMAWLMSCWVVPPTCPSEISTLVPLS